MNEIRVPEINCQKCGYRIDTFSDLKGKAAPHAGDLSMCMKCGNLAKFNDGLNLVPLTVSDMEEIVMNAELWESITKTRYLINHVIWK